jgi:hypothetical protein
MADGEKALAPLRKHGHPIADIIGPMPYTGFQAAFDPLLTPGMRNYWKSHDFVELSDGLIETLLALVPQLPSPHTEIFIAQLGGATKRIASDATAYRHREAEYVMNVHGRWVQGHHTVCNRRRLHEFPDAGRGAARPGCVRAEL